MDFIKDKIDYELIKSEVQGLQTGSQLPEKVLSNQFRFILFSDFDLLFTKFFFDGWKNYLKKSNQDEFVYYVISPDPEEYFLRYFGFYNVIKGDTSTSFEQFISKMNVDPGGSPADAIIHNSNILLIYSSSKRAVIFGDRENEIAVVGLTSKTDYYHFFNSINKEYLFTNINDLVEVIKGSVSRNKEISKRYQCFLNTLIDTYKEFQPPNC